MIEIKSGIYKIINVINNECYVGSAVNFHRRFGAHRRGLNKNSHANRHLQSAWNKYGENNFKFVIIEEVLEKALLIKREQFYLDIIKPEYNESPTAGSLLGFTHSQETREKISKGMMGIKRSARTRKKMSDAKKGVPRSPETIEKMRLGQIGKRHSEEAKKKISAALAGNKRCVGRIPWNKKRSENEIIAVV